jgi:hypothetical protein
MCAKLPSVDDIHRDILAVPPDVLTWLRHIEEQIVATYETISRPVGEPISVLREVRDEYRHLVESDNSLFRRTLRLPVGHLRAGTPARARLDQLVADLERRAHAALHVQGQIEVLRDKMRELAPYRDGLPHIAGNLLKTNRLELDQIDRMRRPVEVEAALERVGHVMRQLEELLPADAFSASVAPADAEITRELTNLELRALRGAAMRRRSWLQRDVAVSDVLRRAFLRQLASLQVSGARRAPEVDTEALVLSQIFQRSVQSEAAGMPSDQVAALVALANAKARVDEADAKPASQPRTPIAENTLFVVPIGEGYVHISSDLVSVIRVWTAGIRPDALIECLPVPVFTDGLDRGATATDLIPLFDGVEEGPTTWYRTRRRLRVRILGKDESGWYGRVETRGLVEAVTGNPWSSRHGDPTAVRVWGTESSLYETREKPLQASRGGVLWELLDVRAEVARIPVPGFERAIRKVPVSRARELELNIEAEGRLFDALARRTNVELLPRGLIPIGTALVEGNTSARPVYAMPDALTRQECPPIEAWLRSSLLLRMAALRATARIIRASHEVGYCIGLIHLDALAFGIVEMAHDGTARPGAVLVAAPWTVPLGTPFQPGSRAEEGVKYDHLSLRFAPIAVRSSQPARRQDDAISFALMMLELLVLDLRVGTGLIWTTTDDPIIGLSTRFILPVLAKAVIGAINRGEEGAERLLKVVEMLAGREPLREADLAAVLSE